MAVQGRRWSSFIRRRRPVGSTASPAVADRTPAATAPPFDIAPNDPIIAYFCSVGGVVDIEELDLDSPALRAMKAAGVKMVVPLISQGELIGLLNLGPRLSQQDYSTDDRALLNNLATQTAPAVRVAQLVRQQQAEAQQRERIEHELRIARLIQHTLLPKAVPQLDGWKLAAHYQPAREVGGDFYDFLELRDGRLGLVVGDVTDKGVPAALVMATTRSIMRTAAQRLDSPGVVLQRANDLLYPDIPANMFVTCLYAILDEQTGRLVYANAGHDLPYHKHGSGVAELRARGMPLGLMPGMSYEEKETVLRPGDSVLFYSDGLVEAHNAQRQMFSFGRLQNLIAELAERRTDDGASLVDYLLQELERFTGPGWEQEDDITLVTLQRAEESMNGRPSTTPQNEGFSEDRRLLAEFTVASEPGNERIAMRRVEEAVQGLGLTQKRVEQLKTAVAEATMNAMEHGNKYRAELTVLVRVFVTQAALEVDITDQGGATEIARRETPDLEAKLENLQTPRGWGLFLIENMVDEMRVMSDESTHTVELIIKLGGTEIGNQTA